MGSHGTPKSGCVLCRLDRISNAQLGEALRPADPTSDDYESEDWDEEILADRLVFRGENGDAAVLTNLGIEGTEVLDALAGEWDLPMEMAASYVMRVALENLAKNPVPKPNQDDLIRVLGDVFVHRGDAYDFGSGAVWPDREDEESSDDADT